MKHSDDLQVKVLRAVRAAPWSIQAVASAYGISHNTVTRWAVRAKLRLPPPAERVAMGGLEGSRRRWGDWERRRELARRMRAGGAPLAEIAAACGYRSLAGAHYATEVA